MFRKTATAAGRCRSRESVTQHHYLALRRGDILVPQIGILKLDIAIWGKGMSPLRNGVIFVCSHIVRGYAYIERVGCSIMLLSEIKAYLLDMDGTVYLGPNPIPGAAAFIHYLQAQCIPFLFLTNNPSADAACYSTKLRSMGMEVGPENILTAGEATAIYLMEETPWRKVYVLGTPCFENELRSAGLILDSEEPEAVIISFDKTLTYEKLERACLLLREGLPYIATNPDTVCPTEYGYIPDCGAIAALLESAAHRTPRFIGKPSPDFAKMALVKLGVEGPPTAMVGDRLYTDMEMARQAGLASMLVLSGESTKEDLLQVKQQPNFVFESVAALHQAMETV